MCNTSFRFASKLGKTPFFQTRMPCSFSLCISSWGSATYMLPVVMVTHYYVQPFKNLRCSARCSLYFNNYSARFVFINSRFQNIQKISMYAPNHRISNLMLMKEKRQVVVINGKDLTYYKRLSQFIVL